MVERLRTGLRGIIPHEWSEVTSFVIFFTFMGIGLPLIVGFGLLGFEESFVSGRPFQFGDYLSTFIIYIPLMLFTLGTIVFKIREIQVTNLGEHPSHQSNPKHFSVGILHDPEQDGLLYNAFEGMGLSGKRNPMRWSLSIFRNFIIAILIFGTIGLFQAINAFQFVGTPTLGVLSQQITPISEVIFISEPAATTETLSIIFFFCLFLGEFAWLISKFRLSEGVSKTIYFTIASLLTLLIGFFWAFGFHRIVYGNDEAALFATFIFGTVGALLTILTGTIIYFYVWHFMNNAFVKMAELFIGNEDFVFITSAILVGIFILWISGEIVVHQLKKKFGRNEPLPKVPN